LPRDGPEEVPQSKKAVTQKRSEFPFAPMRDEWAAEVEGRDDGGIERVLEEIGLLDPESMPPVMLSRGVWGPVQDASFVWSQLPDTLLTGEVRMSDLVQAVRAEAVSQGRHLVCIVAVVSQTSVINLNIPTRELLELGKALREADGAEALPSLFAGSPYILRQLELSPNLRVDPSGRTSLCAGERAQGAFTRLAEEVSGVSLELVFTSISRRANLSLVREEKRSQVQEAAAALLDQTTGLGADPRGALRETSLLWEAIQPALQTRLEAIIEQLSKVKLDTYEEKRQLAAEVAVALQRWGFRAVSPATGVPSYLRCRQTPQNPRGFFYFQHIAGQDAVHAPQEEAKTGSATLPAFKLVGPSMNTRPDTEQSE
jgi:hypothetical protein